MAFRREWKSLLRQRECHFCMLSGERAPASGRADALAAITITDHQSAVPFTGMRRPPSTPSQPLACSCGRSCRSRSATSHPACLRPPRIYGCSRSWRPEYSVAAKAGRLKSESVASAMTVRRNIIVLLGCEAIYRPQGIRCHIPPYRTSAVALPFGKDWCYRKLLAPHTGIHLTHVKRLPRPTFTHAAVRADGIASRQSPAALPRKPPKIDMLMPFHAVTCGTADRHENRRNSGGNSD